MRIYVPNAGTAKGVVNFDRPVGSSGGSVTLVSDTPAIATVVSPLAVFEGDIGREFVITFVSAGDCIVTATYDGVSKTVDVTCVAVGGGSILYPMTVNMYVNPSFSAEMNVSGEDTELIELDSPLVQSISLQSVISLEVS